MAKRDAVAQRLPDTGSRGVGLRTKQSMDDGIRFKGRRKKVANVAGY
jgi:hypothetical protein